jgi:iron complex outermembrane receptor protein
MANLLYEYKKLNFKHRQEGLFQPENMNRYTLDYNFFSPRVGITYSLSDDLSCYSNLSYALREPSDDDLYNWWNGADELGENPLFARSDTIRSNGNIQYIEWSEPYVKPESVVDYEAGIGYSSEQFSVKANVYYMDFRDEIVMLGGRDKEGRPIKGNADKTVHSGIEIQGDYLFHNYLRLGGNLSYSKNYFKEFIQKDYDEERDRSGNRLAGFPDWLSNIYASFSMSNLTSTLSWRYVGDRYLDITNNKERTVAAFQLYNLHLSYRLKNVLSIPELRILFKIYNLFDKTYETHGYFDSWYETAYLYPGALRNYYLGVTFNL